MTLLHASDLPACTALRQRLGRKPYAMTTMVATHRCGYFHPCVLRHTATSSPRFFRDLQRYPASCDSRRVGSIGHLAFSDAYWSKGQLPSMGLIRDAVECNGALHRSSNCSGSVIQLRYPVFALAEGLGLFRRILDHGAAGAEESPAVALGEEVGAISKLSDWRDGCASAKQHSTSDYSDFRHVDSLDFGPAYAGPFFLAEGDFTAQSLHEARGGPAA